MRRTPSLFAFRSAARRNKACGIARTGIRHQIEPLEERWLLSLPAGWYDANVGSASGSGSEAAGVYTVSGTASGFNNGFHYAYTSRSGNFDMAVRLSGVTSPTLEGTGAGLMVRADLSITSPQAYAGWDSSDKSAGRSCPVWYRITRYGDVLTSYRSLDGTSWVYSSVAHINGLAQTVDVGLAVTGSSGVTATMDSLSLSSLTPSYTTSWVGNSFGDGAAFIPDGVDALAVSSSGIVYSNVSYDEGGSAASIFGETSGQGLKLGRLGYTGIISGGKAIVVYGDRVYLAASNMIKGYSVTSTGGAGTGLNTSSSSWSTPYTGSPQGLAVRNGELYISDTANNRILVYNITNYLSVSLSRSWTVASPGPLAFDGSGNLWVIHRNPNDASGNAVYDAAPNEGDRIECWTSGSGGTPGTQLPDKTISASGLRPCALAFDSTHGRLLVADNGVDQQIKAYVNLAAGDGTPILDTTFFNGGAFGYQGGVYAGPNPGLLNDPSAGGAARFCRLTSIALDSSGNLYVGSKWANTGELRKYSSSGEMAWRLYGTTFVQTAAVDPGSDPSASTIDVYSNRYRYQVDLTQDVGQESTLVSTTWGAFDSVFSSDGISRLAWGGQDSVIQRIGGERFLFIGGARIYRFDGDIAIPAGSFTTDGSSTISHWYDADGDGLSESGETTVLSGWYTRTGAYIASNGDIWVPAKTSILRFQVIGVDSHGVPQYSTTPQTYAVPAPLVNVWSIDYDAATDTMYLAGTTPEYDRQTDAAWYNLVNRVLVRYDNWSTGNRTASWQIVLPYDPATATDGGGQHMFRQISSLDVAGDYIFAQSAYETAGDGSVYVYDRTTGNLVTVLRAGPEVGGHVGAQDNGCKIHAFARSNGEYLIFSEDDLFNKTLMYRWQPSAPVAAPTASPVLRASAVEGQVTLNWDMSAGGAVSSGLLSGYNLYRATAANGGFTKLNSSPLSSPTYVDSAVVPGVTYYYAVSAVNTLGEGPRSVSLAIAPARSGATFRSVDATTTGSWKNTYGTQGYMVFGDSTSLPSWAKVSLPPDFYTVVSASATTTTNVGDLQRAQSDTEHVNAPYKSSSTSWSFEIELTDGQTHQVALYLQPSHSNGLGDVVSVCDAGTGTVLDVQEARSSDTSKGVYLVYNITGHVRFNVVLSSYVTDLNGIFIDQASAATNTTRYDPMVNLTRVDTTRSTTAWQLSTGQYWQYGHDAQRMIPSTMSAQWLTWNAPAATSFSTSIYFNSSSVPDPSSRLALYASQDGSTWTAVAMTGGAATTVYNTTKVRTFTNSAALPANTNYLRLQLTPIYNTSNIQIGDVTIGVPANLAPTIVTPAAASPAVAYATTVDLSVLGTDDAGEGGLRYSWAAIGDSPAGVSFSANGTNAARNTTATFTQAGAYTLQVTGFDTGGLAITSTVTVNYFAVPASPGGLTATTASAGQINLSWNAAIGATSYNLYRSTTSGGEGTVPVATGISSASYSDTGLNSGTTYYYKVAAVNAGGASAQSSEASAVTIAAVPGGLTATAASSSQINLSWNGVNGATTYNLYRSSTSGGQGTVPVATGITSTGYADTGLTPGATYYYTVAAVNAGGISSQSSQASAITIASAPSGLTATAASPGQVALSWSAVSGAATYNLYRSATSGGQGTTPVATGITSTSFSDTGLSYAATYYYTVAAVNAGGISAQSSEASATTLVPTTAKLTGTVMGTPVAGNAFDGSLTTYVNSPTGPAWAGLNLGASYTIQSLKYAPRTGQESRMVGGTFQVSNIADFSTATTIYTITTAPPAGSLTTVSVSVSGSWQYIRYVGPSGGYCNVSELEFWGIPASGSVAPVAPTSLTASTASITQINLGWADNSTNETGFKIERATNSTFTQNLTLVATTAANATSYSDSGVVPGTRYYYRVRATNAVGDSVNCVSVTALATVSSKLTGTVLSPSGATYNGTNLPANAFDGALNTYVDSTSGAGWVGLDLGSAKTITAVRLAARSGLEHRMLGGYFQVSNVADFSTATAIYTITGDAPAAGSLTTINLNVSGTWRYIRYVGPSNGYTNVAELEFWGF